MRRTIPSKDWVNLTNQQTQDATTAELCWWLPPGNAKAGLAELTGWFLNWLLWKSVHERAMSHWAVQLLLCKGVNRKVRSGEAPAKSTCL